MAEALEVFPDSEEDTLSGKYLTFSLGSEVYGIEIRYVTEIIGMHTITEVPDLPEHVRGIINLRGRIIPVIDVRLRFRKPPREYNDRTCIIVVDIKGMAIGLIVDTVAEVLAIAEQDIVCPPQVNGAYQQRFIKSIGKVGDDIKLILDSDQLLSDGEMAGLDGF
ncbi:MAG TPA: chemotaxis protein CheW [Selenomonadales bacterium]|nr:chemotaxis protein CheW [Selenomonadales bacterium]